MSANELEIVVDAMVKETEQPAPTEVAPAVNREASPAAANAADQAGVAQISREASPSAAPPQAAVHPQAQQPPLAESASVAPLQASEEPLPPQYFSNTAGGAPTHHNATAAAAAGSDVETYQNLFITKLHRNIKDQDLLALFAPFGGKSATVMLDAKTGRSKGFGFVLFDTEAEGRRAHEAMHQKQITVAGCTAQLSIFPSKHDAKNAIDPSPSLYVRNVPVTASREEVERMLEQFGSVAFCAMREEPDGLPVWVILVEYDCQQCADNALSHLRHNTTLYPGGPLPVIAKYAKAMDRKRSLTSRKRQNASKNCPFRSQRFATNGSPAGPLSPNTAMPVTNVPSNVAMMGPGGSSPAGGIVGAGASYAGANSSFEASYTGGIAGTSVASESMGSVWAAQMSMTQHQPVMGMSNGNGYTVVGPNPMASSTGASYYATNGGSAGGGLDSGNVSLTAMGAGFSTGAGSPLGHPMQQGMIAMNGNVIMVSNNNVGNNNNNNGGKSEGMMQGPFVLGSNSSALAAMQQQQQMMGMNNGGMVMVMNNNNGGPMMMMQPVQMGMPNGAQGNGQPMMMMMSPQMMGGGNAQMQQGGGGGGPSTMFVFQQQQNNSGGGQQMMNGGAQNGNAMMMQPNGNMVMMQQPMMAMGGGMGMGNGGQMMMNGNGNFMQMQQQGGGQMMFGQQMAGGNGTAQFQMGNNFNSQQHQF